MDIVFDNTHSAPNAMKGTMPQDTQTFATEDMTLVAILKIRGVEPVEMEKSNGGCKWIFTCTRVTEEILEEYHSEEAYVEPKEFARKLGLVRTEMYRFLGVQPRRVRN